MNRVLQTKLERLVRILQHSFPKHRALSFAQQRLWFIDQLEPGSTAYNVPAALRMSGALDVAALQRSFTEIVRRHEVLRTVFEMAEGEARQRIAAPCAVVVPVVDLSTLEQPERETVARRLIAEEAATGFDLAHGPLLRVMLLRLAEREHVLSVNLHHIVTDGWSTGILVREFVALYEAYCAGRPSPLVELEIQYADFAAWQREWLEGEVLDRELDYWRVQLAGLEPLELPVDAARSAASDHPGGWMSFALTKPVSEGLGRIARDTGATLFMVLLAGWKVLLSRYSGQEDIAVGTAIANRNRLETEGLIGFFVNTLVLRSQVEGERSFAEYVGEVRRVVLEAYEHQDLPFERVVEEVGAERDLSRSPLFQAMLVLQNVPEEELRMGDLRLEGYETRPRAAKFELSMALSQRDGQLVGTLGYASDLFDRERMERLLEHWQRLLESAVEDPERRVSDLELLSAEEREQLLYGWNATEIAYPADKCVHELFEEQVERTPDAVAVVFEDNRTTYQKLNEQANRVAHRLRAYGVGPEVRVGIFCQRGLQMVIGVLATLKAGGTYVPMDTAFPRERLAWILEDAQPQVVFTEAKFAVTLSDLGVQYILLAEDEAGHTNYPAENLSLDIQSATCAYIIYTSGSTGHPKGVMIEHRQILNYIEAVIRHAEIPHMASFAMVQPLTVDSSVTVLFSSLSKGGCLHLISETVSLDPLFLGDYLDTQGIECLKIAPSHLAALQSGERAERFVPKSRLIVGGEASRRDWLNEVQAMAPQCVIFNHYGPTETTVGVLMHRLDAISERTRSLTMALGRPLANIRAYVLDETGEPVPGGVPGELHIGGAGVGRGYLNRPGLTADRFMPDKFSGDRGTRLYRTGDVVRYRADGVLEYLGRNDDQVKIRGYRVELGEISAVLSRLEGVREGLVTANDDGQGAPRLVGYVVWNEKEKENSKVEGLRASLMEQLPDYMVPGVWVELNELPLTSHGKVDRKALPVPEWGGREESYEAPQTPAEEILAGIWAQVLGVDRVGRNDNFFELGGHSLLATRLIEKMRRYGVQVSMRAIFVSPTLAELAAAASPRKIEVEVPINGIEGGCEAITPGMLSLVDLTQSEIDGIVGYVPGGASNVQDIYPLAPLQEGIFFHYLMGGEGDAYLHATSLRFASRVRLDDFLSALEKVVARHDILRTAVLWEGLSEPVQVVLRKMSLDVEEVDLDREAGDGAVQLYARYDPRRYRIDIRRAPLLRTVIAYDKEKDCWLMVLLWHHLTGDHRTLEVIREEIRAHLSGQADQLPAPFPFRNLVAQARLGVSRGEHEAFFRQLLGDVSAPTAPFGLLDIHGDGTGIEEARLEVDATLASRLRINARRLGVSAASLCHVSWAQVLARVSGREDVVFGTVIFGRLQEGMGTERGMGPYINTLPVRIEVGGAGVEASVRRVHVLLAELMRHEHASLALAQRCSAVPAPAPLFSALLNYRHSPVVAEQLQEKTAQAWTGIQGWGGEERTNYPVTLSVDDLGENFCLTSQTLASVSPLRVCSYMHMALEVLVDALETAPATALCKLDVLPCSEREQLLYGWNATRREYPAEKCVHELFEEQAERTPDAVAVVFEDRALSYGELNRRANRLAHYLIGRGVKPDTVVAICMERSPEMIVALLGVLKAGGAYVPLDPSYPVERLQFMLQDSAPAVLLTDRESKKLLTVLGDGLPAVDVGDTSVWQRLPARNPDRAALGLTSRHLAYVMYTSGSTGKPKGVMVHHGNIVRLVSNADYVRIDGEDVIAQASNVSFDAATFEIWSGLLHGACVTVIPQTVLLEPEAFGQALRRYEVSILWLTVGLFNQYADDLSMELAALRYLLVGGDALDPQIVRRVLCNAPPQHLINGYGPTETTTFASTHAITVPLEGVRSIPIGRPISNVQMYVLDGDLNPVPVGVPGELYIGGAGVARGYLNRAGLTGERFVPDGFSSELGSRMYKTGDLGRWLSDGTIEFIGRNDDQVKVRGYRIELGEIEAALGKQSGVVQSVVVVREDTPGDRRLVAYYTRAEGEETISAESLRTHLSSSLPGYMVPAAYVELEKLPLTVNGKVDRKALPPPEWSREEDYEAPQTPAEEILAGIWAQVLGVQRVGRNNNFFELGGHSLLATRLMSRMRSVFEVEVPLRWLFESPVLCEFAVRVEELRGSGRRMEAPALVRRERSGSPALSFAQQRLWFIDQLEPGSAAYNVPAALRMSGALDVAALQRSFTEIVRRHEVLRTVFEVVEGEARQRIAAPCAVVVPVVDLGTLEQPERERSARRLIAEEAAASFDLAHGPLLRVMLLRLAEREHVLSVNLHHIVTDGWSTGILVREFVALYEAYCAGRPSPLVELEIQYADFAAWQREWLEGEVLDRELDYWRVQLAGLEPLELPVDFPRSAVSDHRGGMVPVKLSMELSRRLRMLGREAGVTLFMVLLAGWKVLLSRYSGQEDFAVGTDIANRNRLETEGLIGFFINQLVLRSQVKGELSFAEYVAEIRRVVLEAYEHQDLPFERLVDEISPDRSLNRTPLFQAKLVLQNVSSETMSMPGLSLESLGGEHTSAKFDLTLIVADDGDSIVGGIEYASDLFERATVERLAGHWQRLLESAVEDPERRISDLEMLSTEEREQLLYGWNATEIAYPADKCVHELFEAQVDRTPDAVAVVFEDRALSYGELNRRANQWARELRSLGVEQEVRVGLCLERSVEMVVALLSVLKAGGAYVPLDPAYPLERLGYMVEDAGLAVVLTERALAGRLPGGWAQVVQVDEENWLQSAAEQPGAQLERKTKPENLAYVMYTSGSTGKPKGVMVQHGGVVNYLSWALRSYAPTAGSIVSSSLSFDATVTSMYGPLLCGGAVRLLPEHEEMDGLEIQLGRDGSCGLVKITPAHLEVLGRSLASQNVRCPVEVFVIGGEKLSVSTVALWRGLQPDVRLVNEYGPTETVVGCATYDVPSCWDKFQSVPIGSPISNVQMYMLDGDLNPVPVGVPGELYIGGAGVARGYLNRAGLTGERFIPNGFSAESGSRMYKTGDLGRWLSDGTIEFLGRNDDQVKVRGYRIELGEIEARLAEHAAISGTVVVVREDTPGDRRLVAYYTRAEGAGSVSQDLLRTHLSSSLPGYMVPAAYVELEKLPLTSNRKVDRKALPVPEWGGGEESYEAPQTPAEEILAGIWAQVLGVERVGRNDNFFKLGGHSLLAIVLIERMRHRGVQTDLRTLFSTSTLAELALASEEIEITL